MPNPTAELLRQLIEWAKTSATMAVSLAVLAGFGAVLRYFKPLREMREWIAGARRHARVRKEFPRYLEAYREALAHHAFRVRHPWIPAPYTLDRLLVRAHFRHEGRIRDFAQYLHELLSLDRASRPPPILALTGPVGSGKTVTLGLAMEVAWSVKQGSERGPAGRMSKYFPTLFSFADLRDTGFDVYKTLRASLSVRDFAGSEKNREEIAELFLQDMLLESRVLVLADTLDELDRSDQQRALLALASFISAKRIPCIFTSREGVLAAHVGSLSSLSYEQIALAEIPRATIDRFIDSWPFAKPRVQAAALRARLEDEPALACCARTRSSRRSCASCTRTIPAECC